MKISAIQMNSGGEKAANLAQAGDLVARVGEADAPEFSLLSVGAR